LSEKGALPGGLSSQMGHDEEAMIGTVLIRVENDARAGEISGDPVRLLTSGATDSAVIAVWLKRWVRLLDLRHQTGDHVAALGNLDLLALIQKALDLPETIAEVVNRSFSHGIHFRVTNDRLANSRVDLDRT